MKKSDTFDQTEIFDLLIEAHEFRKKHEYERALEIYLDIANRQGETSEVNAMISFCYFAISASTGSDNYDNAIQWIKKGICLSPKKASLYAQLGQIYHLGTLEFDLAIRMYRKTIMLTPNDAKILCAIASLYEFSEDVVTLEEAIRCLENAVRIDTDNSDYHLRLGKLYYTARRFDDAVREFEESLLNSCTLASDAKAIRQYDFSQKNDNILSQ